MTDRVTPPIGDPPQEPGKPKIRVTRDEINRYINRRRLPNTKRARRTAREAIRRKKFLRSLPRGRDIVVNQPDQPWSIIYGKVRTGGVFSLLHQITSGSNLYLHHIITLACHEIEKVDKIFLDENEVTFAGSGPNYGWANGGTRPDSTSIDYTNLVYLNASNDGTTGQSAYSDAITNLPSIWTSTHKQSNRAHVYLQLKWNPEIFADGQPDISFEVRGKPVYDPRTTLTAYSNNAALVIADYLTDSVFGMGYSLSDLDTSTSVGGLQWAADICDQNVSLKAGGTEKRYTINGVLDSEQSHEEILAEMEASFGGHVLFTNGKWKFFPGTYLTPSIILTEDDLRGAPEIELLGSRADVFNSVRGTFVSSENNYTVADFPAVSISAYVTEDDGETIWEDLSYPLTTSATMAQRLARIELERTRRDIKLRAPFGLKALQLEPGDTVQVTLSRYGFSSKVFEVDDFDFYIDDEQGLVIDLSLNEIDSGVFSWTPASDEQDINVAPNTTLPDPTKITAPSGLALASGTSHLYLRGDGTVASRLYASWTQSSDPYVTDGGRIELQYKKNAASTWQSVTALSGEASSFYLTDVEDGVAYDVRIRFANAIGAISSWTTSSNHTVVGKTAPPSNVTGLSSAIEESGLRLSWTAVSDLDVREYELRVGASWAAGTVIARVRATNYLWEFQTAGSYTVRIKAIDTSGNYSTTDGTLVVSTTAPGVVRNLIASTNDSNVMLDWESPATITTPIARYRIYKGAAFATASFLGYADDTFHAIVESSGGTFKYWVTAIDEAGNEGTESSITTTVLAPQDYVLRETIDIDTPLMYDVENALVGEENSVLRDDLPLDAIWDFNAWISAENDVTLDYKSLVATQDQNGAASIVVDQYGNLSNFTEPTRARWPLITRSDNKENRAVWSHDFSKDCWSITNAPVTVSGNTISASGGSARHGIAHRNGLVPFFIGQTCVMTVVVKYVNNQYLWIGDGGDSVYHGIVFDVQNGRFSELGTNILWRESEDLGGGKYKIEVAWRYNSTISSTGTNWGPGVYFNKASSTSSPSTFTPAGEQFELYEFYFRENSADEDLIKTEGASQLRGIGAGKALWFYGYHMIESPSPLSTVLDLDDKLVYIAFRPDYDQASSSSQLFGKSNSTPHFAINTVSKNIRVENYDGTAWRYLSTAYGVGVPTIIRVRQDASNLYVSTKTPLHDFAYDQINAQLKYQTDLWSKVNITPSYYQAKSPITGWVNVNLLAPNSTNALHYVYTSTTLVSGNTYRWGGVFKASGYNELKLWLPTTLFGGVAPEAVFDLRAGTVGSLSSTVSDAGIEEIAEGYYHCWIDCVPSSSGGTTPVIQVGSAAFAGDTFSGILVDLPYFILKDGEATLASAGTSTLGNETSIGAYDTGSFYSHYRGAIATIICENDNTLNYRTDALERWLSAMYLENHRRLDTSLDKNAIIGPVNLERSINHQLTPKDPAVRLSGSSNYLLLTDRADVSTGDIDFTFGAWVKLSRNTDGYVVGKYNGPSNFEYGLVYNYNRFDFNVSGDGVNVTTLRSDTEVGFGTILFNTWYFIVCWHDAINNRLGMSINGTSGDKAYSSGCYDSSANFHIGARGAGSSPYLDGVVSRGFFSKQVLTADDRTELYNSGDGKRYSQLSTALQAKFAAYWDMKEKDGERRDSVGSNHLTPVGVLGPVTWEWGLPSNEHKFEDIQDQLDAGSEYFSLPHKNEASVLKYQNDYGVVLPSSLITVSYTEEDLQGSVSVTPQIAYSQDGDTWTEVSGVKQVFASNFQYVRVTLTLTPDDSNSLIKLSDVSLKVDVKKRDDEFVADVLAADADGTWVDFNLTFLDVSSVQVTPVTEDDERAIAYGWQIASPTGCYIKLFDSAGTRIDGSVSVLVKGIIDPTA